MTLCDCWVPEAIHRGIYQPAVIRLWSLTAPTGSLIRISSYMVIPRCIYMHNCTDVYKYTHLDVFHEMYCSFFAFGCEDVFSGERSPLVTKLDTAGAP